jgi:hypothetical protein
MSWNFSTARDDRPAMRSPTKSHNRPNRQLAALAVGFLAMLFLAQPAAAHGGEVAIDVVPTVSGTTVTFNVHLTFEEDGHNVAGQTVDVSAVGPTGTKTAQLPASDAEGRTSGAIDLDAGSWSVTFTTEEGTATVEQVVDGVGDTAASSTTAAPGRRDDLDGTGRGRHDHGRHDHEHDRRSGRDVGGRRWWRGR